MGQFIVQFWQKYLEWKSNWQYLVISGYIAALATVIAMPFFWLVPLSPLWAYIHRFSLSLEVGEFSKTLTVFIIITPIVAVKALYDFWKASGWKSWPRGLTLWAILILLLANIYGVVISLDQQGSLIALFSQLVNISLLIIGSWWMYRYVTASKELKDKAVALFTKALIAILLINIFVSWHQFVDCSVIHRRCRYWVAVDAEVPSKLLSVGHQSFINNPTKVIRAPGLFGDVNFNGAFLLLSLVWLQILLMVDLTRHKAKYLWWLMALIVLTLLTFVLTASRSALISWVAVQIPFFWYLLRPWWKRQKEHWSLSRIIFGAGIFIGSCVVVALLVWFSIPAPRRQVISESVPSYMQRIINVSTDRSAQDRLRLWQAGQQFASECRWLGCGLDTFSQLYQSKINAEMAEADPHSGYITVLVEQGIPGVLAFVFFISVAWWSLWQYLKNLKSSIWSAKQSEQLRLLLPVMFMVAIPFYSIFAITYYGFFLPMVWWWGLHHYQIKLKK